MELPGQADDLRTAAELSRKGDYEGAARLLAARLTQAPDEVLVRIELVRALHAAGDAAGAREAAIALEDKVTDEASWKAMLSLFRLIENPTRMQLVTLKFLKLQPMHEGATVELIKLLIDGRRFDDAVSRASSLSKRANLSSETLFQLIQCQIRLGKLAEATETGYRGMIEYPQDFECALGVAQALNHLGQGPAIRQLLPHLIDLAQEDTRRNGWVAEIASWAGQINQTRSAALKVLNTGKLSDLAKLQIARAYNNVGDFASMMAVLKIIDLDKSSDIRLLQRVLDLVQAVPPDLAVTRITNELGVITAKRLSHLTGLKDTYDPIMRGFEISLGGWPRN